MRPERGNGERARACLKRFGFDVRLRVFDDEDHYLLFSQPQAVLDEILEWMGIAKDRQLTVLDQTR